MEKKVRKTVSDLGCAAYMKMHGYKCVGKKNRNFYFELNAHDANSFDQLNFEYANSPMHDFDSCIMSLKKMPEYLPD